MNHPGWDDSPAELDEIRARPSMPFLEETEFEVFQRLGRELAKVVFGAQGEGDEENAPEKKAVRTALARASRAPKASPR